MGKVEERQYGGRRRSAPRDHEEKVPDIRLALYRGTETSSINPSFPFDLNARG